MKTSVIPIFLVLLSLNLLAQTLPTDFTSAEIENINTSNLAAAGDLYHDTDLDQYYIGLTDGSLKIIGDISATGTNSNNILRWNSSTSKWDTSSFYQPNALNYTKIKVITKKKARILVQNEANINTTSFTVTPVAFEKNQTNATIIGTKITDLIGDVRFTFQPNFFSSIERSNLNCAFLHNGDIIERVHGSNYIRSFSGHNSSSSKWIFEYENVTPLDTFEFVLQQEANNGIVQLISTPQNKSLIYIDQFFENYVYTEISLNSDTASATGPTGEEGTQGIQGISGLQGPPSSTPADFYHASGNIMADGTPNFIADATVSNTGTGRYTITFDSPHPNQNKYPIIITMEQNAGADDYEPVYYNFTANGFQVEIREQDDGTNGGSLRNAGFSFFIPL